MDLSAERLKRADHAGVDEHEDELGNKEIMDDYVLPEVLNRGSTRDYMSCSKVQRLMEDTLKVAIQLATTHCNLHGSQDFSNDASWRSIITEIVEESTRNALAAGNDEFKK